MKKLIAWILAIRTTKPKPFVYPVEWLSDVDFDPEYRKRIEGRDR